MHEVGDIGPEGLVARPELDGGVVVDPVVEGPSADAEELRRAIDYASGSFRLSFETPMSYGQRFGEQLLQDGEIEPIDVTVARLRAVTAEDVQRVGQRVIGKREFSLAVVGPSADADRLAAILAA